MDLTVSESGPRDLLALPKISAMKHLKTRQWLSAGIAKATLLMSGWAMKFFDYDNDGNLDLFIVNGHPDDLIDKIVPSVSYREPLLTLPKYRHRIQKCQPGEGGPIFSRPMSGRGMALGDFNNDGAIDVLLSNNDEAPVLLQNEAGRQNH